MNVFNRMFGRWHRPTPVDVLSEDWDTLVILDACRADTFEALNHIDGKYETRYSPASASKPYIERSFIGRDATDTIYVSANPYAYTVGSGTFFKLVPAFDDWDPDLRTVPPSAMVRLANEAHKRHTDKRLIVHFMQPHTPFIGERGREIHRKLYAGGIHYIRVDGEKVPVSDEIDVEKDQQSISLWEAVADASVDITTEDIVAAYRENVVIAIDHANDLVSSISGKAVVTADHGELLGERRWGRRRFGHPPGSTCEAIRRIPWHVVNDGQRREITRGDPHPVPAVAETTVNQRLAALGYLE